MHDRLPIVPLRGRYVARRENGWTLVTTHADGSRSEMALETGVLTAERLSRALNARVTLEIDCVRVGGV